MIVDEAYFDVVHEGEQEFLVPRNYAAGGWASSQLRGSAVAAALARATELAFADLGLEGLRPARFTLDLFRPAPAAPATTRTTVRRVGRRIALIDAEYVSDGVVAARSATMFIAATSTPNGTVWSSNVQPVSPSSFDPPAGDRRLYYSAQEGWLRGRESAQTAARKQSWHYPVGVVSGEELTPFQAAAGISDISNVISNWGDSGLAYINADITLALARLPEGDEIGLSAIERLEADGISVGVVAMYDRAGVFATTTVVSLANSERTLDPRESAFV